MSIVLIIVVLFTLNSGILSKKAEPICVQHLDSNEAYPCESRPTKEPLSLQYSKAQSKINFK